MVVFIQTFLLFLMGANVSEHGGQEVETFGAVSAGRSTGSLF